MNKKILLSPILSMLCLTALAQTSSVNVKYTDDLLISKLFPLIAMIQQEEGSQPLQFKNKVLNSFKAEQFQRAKLAIKDCHAVICYAEALKISQKEIKIVGDELTKNYAREASLQAVVATIRKRGVYAIQEGMADTCILRNSWNKTAQGLNKIIDVYVGGLAPRYAKIDSISFKKGDPVYQKQLEDSLKVWSTKFSESRFYQLPLKAALAALRMNGRDEAARFVPLTAGLNEAPYQSISTTNFNAFQYSVILIPGLGPEEQGLALDPKGAARCREGALRYKKGLAPFIVVSGGNVHPFKTPFNEAVEMKRYMVEQLGIPADVILVEPDARHTTTNLRNTARIIYNFKIPAEKPVLIVTDESQSSYIVNRMGTTAMRDLGYLPYRDLKSLSPTETSFYPIWESLQVDPLDPLDP